MICGGQSPSYVDERLQVVLKTGKIMAVTTYRKAYMLLTLEGGYKAFTKVIGKYPLRKENCYSNQALAELVGYYVDRITGRCFLSAKEGRMANCVIIRGQILASACLPPDAKIFEIYLYGK